MKGARFYFGSLVRLTKRGSIFCLPACVPYILPLVREDVPGEEGGEWRDVKENGGREQDSGTVGQRAQRGTRPPAVLFVPPCCSPANPQGAFGPPRLGLFRVRLLRS